MTIQDQSFIDQRMRALAIMYLTRRKDLSLNFDEKVGGIDLLVDILPAKTRDEEAGRRMFGVDLESANGSASIEQAQKQIKSAFKGKRRIPKLPFPLCLFLFTMTDNKGYFTWLIEPSIQHGVAKLRTADAKASVRILDKAALDEIIEKTNTWYDVFYATINV